jgi:hypothetical protein
MLDVGSNIRIKNAPFLAKAPDITLQEIISFQVDLHKMFADRPLVCNALLLTGPAGLSSADRNSITEFPTTALGIQLQFKAMAQGRDNPIDRTPPRDEFYTNIITEMLDNGFPEAQLDDFETVAANSPTLCATYISYFEHIRDATFEGADRLRAQTVADMLGN